jgi:hypothetical protein
MFHASANGHVAHESLDLRPLMDTSGVVRRRRAQAADGFTLSCTDVSFRRPAHWMVEPH